MKEYKKLLSICITSKDRPYLLKETISNLVRQIDKRCEIIVTLSNPKKKDLYFLYNYFSIYINNQCLYFYSSDDKSLDQGYDNAVRVSNGKYCWLFCDDDQIYDDSIDLILTKLSYNHDVYYVGADIFSKDLKYKINPSNHFKLTGTIYDKNFFLKEFGSKLSYIGSLIINSDIWKKNSDEKFYGSFFIHIKILLALDKFSTFVIPFNIIKIRAGNALWSKSWFKIWMFIWPEIIWQSNLPIDIKKNIVEKQPWRNMGKLLFTSALGRFDYQIFIENFNYSNPGIFIISIFPKKILNFFMIIYVLLFRSKFKVNEEIYYLVISNKCFYLIKKLFYIFFFKLPKSAL